MRVFCETHRPHVLSLNETWLDSSISDSEIQFPGYSLVRRDKTRRNGGVLIYVSSNLDYKVIQEFENDQPVIQWNVRQLAPWTISPRRLAPSLWTISPQSLDD